MDQHPTFLTLPRRFITRLLVAVMLLLVVLAAIRIIAIFGFGYPYSFGAIAKVDFDWENNLPSYFSTLLLVIAAALLGLIYRHAAATDGKERRRWGLLALIFLAMSIDEASSMHELLIDPLRETLGLSGIFYFAWVVVAIPVVAALGLYFLPFLFRLPSATRTRFILAGALYVGGALGLEFFGGYSYEASDRGPSLVYDLTAHTEELLEMIGLIVFIDALLDYLARHVGRIELRFRTD